MNGENPSQGHQNYEGVECMLYEERMRNLGVFSLGKRLMKNQSSFSLQLPKGGYGEDEVFFEVHIEKTRCSGHKLQQGKFRLAASKEYFP